MPYAKPGVGAVATQASANRQYGPKAIALLEQGLSPEEVVKRITDEDPGRDTRQVAVIDTKGRSAVYTGKRVIDLSADFRIAELATGLEEGAYRLVFHPPSAFFRRVELEVELGDGHHHVPLLVSPYSCASYRGS